MFGREIDARLLSSLSRGHKDTDVKTVERKNRDAGIKYTITVIKVIPA
jgi:hypothetical protein